MKIIIAKLIKNFDFELISNQNLKPIQALTIIPGDGIKCKISLRKI
jgi:hypothetical protein